MTAAPEHPPIIKPQELNTMLLYETLARIRMREDQRRAAHQRLVGRLATVRRWQRLARYAERRARRAAARLDRLSERDHANETRTAFGIVGFI